MASLFNDVLRSQPREKPCSPRRHRYRHISVHFLTTWLPSPRSRCLSRDPGESPRHLLTPSPSPPGGRGEHGLLVAPAVVWNLPRCVDTNARRGEGSLTRRPCFARSLSKSTPSKNRTELKGSGTSTRRLISPVVDRRVYKTSRHTECAYYYEEAGRAARRLITTFPHLQYSKTTAILRERWSHREVSPRRASGRFRQRA